MRNLWDEGEAMQARSELDRRVYSSRLIGSDPALVLHGGGNTSLKGIITDRFGDAHDAIWVKASGFDLGTMGIEGFTALHLAPVLRLAELERLSDTDMVSELKRARFDPSAAAASIEAIVHALIPFRYVDHSHADGVLTLANGGGRAMLERVYGERALILPYVKPGFDLARQIRAALLEHDLASFEAILLEHHGVLTWGASAKESYDRMISICAEAEAWLAAHVELPVAASASIADPVAIARLRGAVGGLAGRALISLPATTLPADEIAGVADRALHGTLTPEHVIHNKPFPAVVGDDPLPGLQSFAEAYEAYVARAANPQLVPL
ncbi:MAG: class II aldolase/adducin family protein, partial [Rhizobiales bacterium]|nr:class II aldolase/adducin family protein [Hyphomicrobiales bacterium]